MKKDLESIFRFPLKYITSKNNSGLQNYLFRRLKIIKQKLNNQMPDACDAVMGSGVEAREEDDEYDEAIRRRRQQVTSLVLST